MADVTGMEVASTREKLLDAAERLFLDKGYDGVGVRDITDSAGVNVAAVNYHFNGKKNLYREFFRRRLLKSNEGKMEALHNILSTSETPDLREVIRVFVAMFLEDMLSSRDSEKFLKLFTTEMSEKGIAHDIMFKECVTPVHRLFREAILRTRPEMAGEKATLCIASIFGQMVHFVRAREVVKRVTGRGYSREFIGDIVEHITDFSMKGIGD